MEKFNIINYADTELPTFAEKQGQKFVNYGSDDHYGEYLRDLYLASSTHSAIVNGVADMIYGGGLDATDREDSDGKKEQWLKENGMESMNPINILNEQIRSGEAPPSLDMQNMKGEKGGKYE